MQESVGVQVGEGVGQRERAEAKTTIEGEVSDPGDRVGEGEGCDLLTVGKCFMSACVCIRVRVRGGG